MDAIMPTQASKAKLEKVETFRRDAFKDADLLETRLRRMKMIMREMQKIRDRISNLDDSSQEFLDGWTGLQALNAELENLIDGTNIDGSSFSALATQSSQRIIDYRTPQAGETESLRDQLMDGYAPPEEEQPAQ